jgi:hypothetical protein
MADYKFNTRKVRISYPHLFQKDQNDKYSMVALIPKEDTATYQKIMDACKAIYKENKDSTFKGLQFDEIQIPIHDGDGRKPKGGAYGAECKGMWVMSAKTTSKPVIVDAYNTPVTSQEEIYPGVWGRINVGFGAYNNAGNRGITCYLNGVKTYNTGERIGNAFNAAEFEDDYDDSEMMADDGEI